MKLRYTYYSVQAGMQKVKTRTALAISGLALAFGGGMGMSVMAFSSAHAESTTPATVVVTPSNMQGWAVADQRGAGAYAFVADSTSPLPTGALQLTTTASNVDKLQLMHEATGALTDVTDLSYYTKQVSGPPEADASYQLAVDLNGDATGGFTTLVYEPYWNGTVQNGAWQSWDVSASTAKLWSSKTFSDGAACSVTNGAGGPPFYSLSELQADCPDAVVQGFGVNVGSYNQNYNVETDAVKFNNTTYNFEQYVVASQKDDCKGDGWKTVTTSTGDSFKNQGQCVSFVNHNDGTGNDVVHAHKH